MFRGFLRPEDLVFPCFPACKGKGKGKGHAKGKSKGRKDLCFHDLFTTHHADQSAWTKYIEDAAAANIVVTLDKEKSGTKHHRCVFCQKCLTLEHLSSKQHYRKIWGHRNNVRSPPRAPETFQGPPAPCLEAVEVVEDPKTNPEGRHATTSPEDHADLGLGLSSTKVVGAPLVTERSEEVDGACGSARSGRSGRSSATTEQGSSDSGSTRGSHDRSPPHSPENVQGPPTPCLEAVEVVEALKDSQEGVYDPEGRHATTSPEDHADLGLGLSSTKVYEALLVTERSEESDIDDDNASQSEESLSRGYITGDLLDEPWEEDGSFRNSDSEFSDEEEEEESAEEEEENAEGEGRRLTAKALAKLPEGFLVIDSDLGLVYYE